MKKSNKILIGGLLTIILVIVAVNIGLYANYKAGNVVPFTESQAKDATSIKEFANTRSIQIRNLKNVVVRLGDKMRVEQYGEHNDDVVLAEQNGNISLSVKDTTNEEDVDFHYVIVYVPENTTITAYKSNVRVEGINNRPIGNLNFNVIGGSIGFEQEGNSLHIDSLNIQANNQATIIMLNTNVNKLAVQMNASEFIDRQLTVNQFSLAADSTSQINLQSKNLLKLITKTTAHE